MPHIHKSVIEPDILLVEVSGRISLGRECQVVEWTVDDVVASGPRKVIFDLSQLEYLDSTGIGILATCCGRIEAAGGEVRLASLQPKVADLIRLAKLHRIINLHDTVPDAVQSFSV